MKHITSLIDDLSRLTELDVTKRSLKAEKNILQQIHDVRERLPTAILKHYDHRMSKGRRGAARVRNGTCGGCHLSLPIGQLADMRRDDVALQVCCNCSVFLLPEDLKPQESASRENPEPVAKPIIQPRKRISKAAV